MTEEQRQRKRAGVHPVLLRRLDKVLAAMAVLGFPMEITDGVRTDEEQMAKYAQGRSKPGAIVTDCDGITRRSNHQTKEDGLGHAVDCAFVDPNHPNSVTWDDDMPWDAYGAACKAVGLKWGIKLKNGTIDRPHVELPRQS